jgi:hypothetical protein
VGYSSASTLFGEAHSSATEEKKGSERKKEKTLENDYIVNRRVGLHSSVFSPGRRWANNNNNM